MAREISIHRLQESERINHGRSAWVEYPGGNEGTQKHLWSTVPAGMRGTYDGTNVIAMCARSSDRNIRFGHTDRPELQTDRNSRQVNLVPKFTVTNSPTPGWVTVECFPCPWQRAVGKRRRLGSIAQVPPGRIRRYRLTPNPSLSEVGRSTCEHAPPPRPPSVRCAEGLQHFNMVPGQSPEVQSTDWRMPMSAGPLGNRSGPPAADTSHRRT